MAKIKAFSMEFEGPTWLGFFVVILIFFGAGSWFFIDNNGLKYLLPEQDEWVFLGDGAELKIQNGKTSKIQVKEGSSFYLTADGKNIKIFVQDVKVVCGGENCGECTTKSLIKVVVSDERKEIANYDVCFHEEPWKQAWTGSQVKLYLAGTINFPDTEQDRAFIKLAVN